MPATSPWGTFTDAIDFAVSRIAGDPDPLNDREEADGHRYVLRVLAAVSESALATFDPARPAFLPMMESVRYLGAAGPDIDYDVALVEPGVAHRVSGQRGGATYVGITVYGHGGDRGATDVLAFVDVDELADASGAFTYEFDHPRAARVIVRQYSHDRATQHRGTWSIERTGVPPTTGTPGRPTVESVMPRIANAAQSVRWNLQLNQLWTPELRAAPNRFVRQTPDDIVAAVPNPDVMYAFSWWRVGDGEALVIDVDPPAAPYWSVQLCDRWFQCFPDRRCGLNDRQVVPAADGSVRIVVADGDPGVPNWLDTGGHRVGTMFFRWLHADPEHLPECRVVPRAAPGGA